MGVQVGLASAVPPVAVHVMVMMVGLTVMMSVVAVIHVVLVAMVMGVHKTTSKHAGRQCEGETDGWRQSKHNRHRPDEGNAPSACSVQSRQHALGDSSSLGTARFRPAAFKRPEMCPSTSPSLPQLSRIGNPA